ncbi:TPA: DEAD/DEAH box helicase [Enterococcus faecalis]|nr:DEAD/DEAH box helicase [Enterococcus faecalis]EJJ0923823.1 DEAD/DEAH box helicase [Enterococcus faecalis]
MEDLHGRKIIIEETERSIQTKLVYLPTMLERSPLTIQCQRCGEVVSKKENRLATNVYYCHACIQLGRVTSCQKFCHLPERLNSPRTVFFEWSGQLTKGQQAISVELCETAKARENRLVWAVTGAGKTEMLFAVLHQTLQEGGRIALASPRVDVCLELFPRIQAVFPHEAIALLHGNSQESYRYTKLVICTTHQLLKFHQAFDLLIVDEVDSFPFVNNEHLYYGVRNARKKRSSLVYLTATPTKELRKLLQQKKLAASILPARYHRRPLPVPRRFWVQSWQRISTKNIKIIAHHLKRLLVRNSVLLFCPSIPLIHQLHALIAERFSDKEVVAVYGSDELRLEKVQAMRQQKTDILITTTILERGVTFDAVSVIVYGANHRVFTSSTLVQIAGRVDRRQEFNYGEVLFLHDGETRDMKEAIRQIKQMNRLASKRGMLDGL